MTRHLQRPATSRSNKGSAVQHGILRNEILLALGALPFCRVWKQDVGVATLPNGETISFGKRGSGDITGIVKNTKSGFGIRIEMEIKTGGAVQEPEQINFERMCRLMGAEYVVVRSVAEALAFVEAVRDK